MAEENQAYDEEGIESEEESSPSNWKVFTDAVLAQTDWTVETIVNQLTSSHIDMNPDFQRRDAWDKQKKSRFIESLILGLPIPQLVLAELKGKKGKYLVMDGKQRLLALMQFYGVGKSAETKNYESLRLKGLTIRKDLNGKTYDSLDHETDKIALDNQPVRTIVVRNWPNEEFLYTVFHRLNTGSVPLSPQELRQSLHPGKFVSWVSDRASKLKSLQSLFNRTTEEPDFRMRDVELLIRFLGFRNFFSTYNGNLKAFLDSVCKSLNADWDQRQNEIEQQTLEMEAAIEGTQVIFQEHGFQVWRNGRFEGRFNRAVFDVMAHYFSNQEIRKKAIDRKVEVKAAFVKMCDQDNEFRASLTSTTKSVESVNARFGIWGARLLDILKIKIDVPGI